MKKLNFWHPIFFLNLSLQINRSFYSLVLIDHPSKHGHSTNVLTHVRSIASFVTLQNLLSFYFEAVTWEQLVLWILFVSEHCIMSEYRFTTYNLFWGTSIVVYSVEKKISGEILRENGSATVALSVKFCCFLLVLLSLPNYLTTACSDSKAHFLQSNPI